LEVVAKAIYLLNLYSGSSMCPAAGLFQLQKLWIFYYIPTHYSSVLFRSLHYCNSGSGPKYLTELRIRLLNFNLSSGSVALDYFRKSYYRNISVVIQLLSSAFQWPGSAI